MQYRLRTLVIVNAIGPIILAGIWWLLGPHSFVYGIWILILWATIGMAMGLERLSRAS
jgi:hypothetical protein